MVQILVFGDSIVYGAWDKEGGWVQRLRKFIDEKNLTNSDFYCLIYNLGVSGDTSEDIIKRFEFEAQQRLKEGEETIIMFGVGTNDSQFLYKENRHKIPLEKFKENVQKLIKAAMKFSSKIVFVGLIPVDETKTTPVPWNTDEYYRNEDLEKYNRAIKEICEENNVHFIDLFQVFKATNFQELLEDGLHPNSKGHQKIFEIVKEFLAENNFL